MTSDYWNNHVLEKLRSIVNKQPLSGVVLKWEYDNHTPSKEENDSLKTLSNAGIFDVSQLGNATAPFTRNEFGILVHNGDAIEAYDFHNPLGDAVLNNFNPIRYEKLCKEFGLDPYDEKYHASLELDGDVPTIIVGKQHYELPALHYGIPTKLISYAYSKRGNVVEQEELKNAGINIPNVRNKLKDSPFAHGKGVLRMFAYSTPSSVKVNQTVQLTAKELEEITAKSIL